MARETRHTVCPYDCPDSCGITVEIENNRIVSFGPRADHPYTRGFLCTRGQEWPRRMRGPDRLTSPLLKSEGGWKPIGWDEALSRTVQGLENAISRHGHRSVLFYSYAGNVLKGNEVQNLFPAMLGGCTMAEGSLCGAEGLSGLAETDPGSLKSRPGSVLQSRGVLLWGRNVAENNLHFMPFLHEARRRGALIGSVEVRTTPTTAFSDYTWLIRPGSDLDLALYLCGQAIRRRGFPKGVVNSEAFAARALAAEKNRIIEETGLDEASLNGLEAFVLETTPLSTWMGWGPQRARSGSSLASVLASLSMLTGNRGLPGGGTTFSQEIEGLVPETLLYFPEADPRIIPRNGLGRALLSGDPPVEASFIVRGNPVSQCGDAASTRRFLETCPFSVCLDYRMSLTARCCSLFLPVSLPLERGGDFVSSYWHDIVQETVAVADPPEGVRHELDIIAEVASGLGLPDRFHPAMEELRRHVRSLDWLEPLAPGMWRIRERNDPAPAFRFPASIERPEKPSGPFRLITVHTRRFNNGQDLRQCRPPEFPPEAAFSPADAEKLGIAPGQAVTLFNDRGSLSAIAALDPARPAGTVVMVQAAEGLNVLVSPEVTSRGHSCINESWIDVKP
jgi:anaerobic selenocysteine-containing dehydrogenase